MVAAAKQLPNRENVRRFNVGRPLARHLWLIFENDTGAPPREKTAVRFAKRAVELLKVDRDDEALAACDHAIALEPSYSWAHQLRGQALLWLDRLDEALAASDRAIALTPDYGGAHGIRGVVLYQLRRFDEALAACDRAIALEPDYSWAHLACGETLLRLDRFDEALAACDRAIQLEPNWGWAQLIRAEALYRLLRCDEALAACDHTIALEPSLRKAAVELRDLITSGILFIKYIDESDISDYDNSTMDIAAVIKPAADLVGLSVTEFLEAADQYKAAKAQTTARETTGRATAKPRPNAAAKETTGRAAAEPRPDWIEAHKRGVSVPEFIREAFAIELRDGSMHKGLFSRYENLRRDFYAYKRHHKLPDWLSRSGLIFAMKLRLVVFVNLTWR